MVSDGTNTAAYSYVANSFLVGQIAFTNNGVLRMTTTKNYDLLNRLTSISSVPSGAGILPASFNYAFNSANQRASVTNADSSYWVYQYDSLGQVISGSKFWSDGTPVAGQQFAYAFDDIGNRQSAAYGGDQAGANLRAANYAANDLNQYTSRTVPGYVDVTGTANPDATISLWASDGSYAPTSRKGAYFRGELAPTNSSGPLWLTVTNLAVLTNGTDPDIISTDTGNLFVAQTPENFSYDQDGNLLKDGRWTYAWDAENRLISMTANSGVGPGQSLAFMYDPQGRRIQKIVSAWNGSAYVPQSSTAFLYDGWNLIAELNSLNAPPTPMILRSYLWGLDLSGSMSGAGGVGGLLAINDSVNGSQFAAFDANGNAVSLVNAAEGTVAANYDYGSFGELIRATGPMAKVNPFRFSTKYNDDETDFLYYGYRYYNSSTGRWLSRDPIDEKGGLNLYEIIANDPIDRLDFLGFSYGTISVTSFDSLNGFYTSGLHVRIRWTPPSDHKCCKCSKAVWVQDKSIVLNKGIWGIYTTPWEKDWDETDYIYPQQQSDLWTCGGLLKDMY